MIHKTSKSDETMALGKFCWAVYQNMDHACRHAEIARWRRRHSAGGMGILPSDPRLSPGDWPPCVPSDDEDPPELR